MKTWINFSGPKTTLVILILLLVNLTSARAQEEKYSTSTGQLIIKAHLGDKSVGITSRNLLILLDYETGKIVMKQEIAALTVNNDSLQSAFNDRVNKYIRFEGKLDIEYINTKGHPPLDFSVEGTLYPGNKHVMGEGHLVHIVQGTAYACILSLSFNLKPDELLPDYQSTGENDEIHLQVIQSLLARENE